MDRGPRKIANTTSMLVAVLASLTMASFNEAAETGAAPIAGTGVRTVPRTTNVVRADGTLAESVSGGIQQVVGKQPSHGRRRPLGSLSLFGGGKSSSSKPQASGTSGRGILDGLFGVRTASSPKSSGTAAVPQNPGSAPLPESVDWDGIPFHQAQSSQGGASKQAPIRDPSASRPRTTSRTTAPNIARSTRTTKTPPALPRPASDDTRVARSTSNRTLSVPAPVTAGPQVSRVPKSSLSSSRSSRRSSSPAKSDISSTVKTTANKREAIRSDDSIDDLVPRVSRRSIATATTAKTSTAKPAESSAPSQAGSSRQASQTPKSATTTPKVASTEPASPTPSADVVTTKVAAKPAAVPAIASQPKPAAVPAPSVATDTSPAKLGSPQPRPAYAASQPDPSRSAPPTALSPQGVPSNVAGFQPSDRSLAQPLTLSQPADLPKMQANATTVPSPYGKAVDTFQTVDPYANVTGSNSGQLSGAGTAGTRVAMAPQRSETATPRRMKLDASSDETLPSVPAPATSTITNDFRATASTKRDFATRKMQPGETAVASELPSIRVVTHGPSEMMIRQTRPYEIRVENRGSIDAEGVLVRAQVPDWAEVKSQKTSVGNVESNEAEQSEQLVWTINRLPAGKSETMTIQLKAARSGLYELDVDWTLVPQHTIAKIRVQQPKLTLTIDGPDEVVYGESETYKVRVLNPGDGIAPDVVFTLSPNSATPQSQQIGNIPAGKEAQFEVELTANDLGDLRIHGLAAGDLELRAEAEKVIRVSAAKLEAMLSGPELKYQNSESMYHLELQNTGTATSEKVVATLQLPSGVEYLGGLDGASVTGSQLRWTIDAMSPKSIREYDFRCKMTSTGEQVFAFDCRGSAAGQAEVSLGTNVQAIADLVLSVNDPVAPAPIGSDVTYEIVIRNRGSKEARDVRAIAQFSHGIEPSRVSGQSGEVLTGQVLFDPIDRIAPGQELRLQVIAKAENEGHHRFRTEVRSGDIVLLAEEATHYMNPRSDRVSRRSSDAESR